MGIAPFVNTQVTVVSRGITNLIARRGGRSEKLVNPVIAQEIFNAVNTIRTVELDRECLLKSVRVFMGFKKLAQRGEVLGSLPPVEALVGHWDDLAAQLAEARGEAELTLAGYPGGVGLAQAAYDRVRELLEACAFTIANCGCEVGCPACVQQATCGSMNRPLDKCGALTLLKHWLSAPQTENPAEIPQAEESKPEN